MIPGLILGVLISASVWSAPLKTGEEIALWPSVAPGSAALSIKEVELERSKDPALHDRAYLAITKPTLTAYVPAKPNGMSVVVAPGGAYARVVTDKEGADVGRAFNERGVTVFVLKYRLPAEGHVNGKDVPLQDAQRALRLVRKNAAEWGLDAQKIGMMGFSAGGHVAASLGVGFDKKVYDPLDAVDQQSARPDFLVLMYPVITMDEKLTNIDSRKNLLGDKPSDALVAEYSTEKHVSKATPQTFIAMAANDTSVPLENELSFMRGLQQNGVSVELHVFKESGHGFGIRGAKTTAKGWTKMCLDWLESLPAAK